MSLATWHLVLQHSRACRAARVRSNIVDMYSCWHSDICILYPYPGPAVLSTDPAGQLALGHALIALVEDRVEASLILP